MRMRVVGDPVYFSTCCILAEVPTTKRLRLGVWSSPKRSRLLHPHAARRRPSKSDFFRFIFPFDFADMIVKGSDRVEPGGREEEKTYDQLFVGLLRCAVRLVTIYATESTNLVFPAGQ